MELFKNEMKSGGTISFKLNEGEKKRLMKILNHDQKLNVLFLDSALMLN